MHLLMCTDARVKGLRVAAVAAAHEVLSGLTRARCPGERQAQRVWKAADEGDCVRATLGGSCVQMGEQLRARVVSRCAAVWVGLPKAWREINTPRRAAGAGAE